MPFYSTATLSYKELEMLNLELGKGEWLANPEMVIIRDGVRSSPRNARVHE